MRDWKEIAASVLPPDFELDEWNFPEYSEEALIKCRNLCKENVCGTYGCSWSCPPGFSSDLKELSEKYGKVAVIKRRFEVDLSDSERLDGLAGELQSSVRDLVLAMRREGYECLGFADGACRYCGKCAYPDPCRFPEMLVPSISAAGVDMTAFAKANGREFKFEKDAVTVYGLIMMRFRHSLL